MARTLQQLKESVERLIEQQGKDAPCAAFIFTNEDVFDLDEEFNPQYYTIEQSELILNEVDELDYIYETIFECIDDQKVHLKHKK